MVKGVDQGGQLLWRKSFKLGGRISGNGLHGGADKVKLDGLVPGNDQSLAGAFHQLPVFFLTFFQAVFLPEKIPFKEHGIELYQAHDKGNVQEDDRQKRSALNGIIGHETGHFISRQQIENTPQDHHQGQQHQAGKKQQVVFNGMARDFSGQNPDVQDEVDGRCKGDQTNAYGNIRHAIGEQGKQHQADQTDPCRVVRNMDRCSRHGFESQVKEEQGPADQCIGNNNGNKIGQNAAQADKKKACGKR